MMKTLHRFKARLRRDSQRGQALVLFAAGLAGFFGIVGLSVDVGRMMFTRTDLQRVADAAALAGGQLLPDSAATNSVAQSYVSKNGDAATTADIVITQEVSSSNDTVKVTARRHIDHFFLKMVGVSGADIQASAKVRSVIVTGYAFTTPSLFPYTVWRGNPGTPGAGGACPYGLCPNTSLDPNVNNGTEVTYRDVNYSQKEVSNSAKTGSDPTWKVTDASFKGFFHHGTDITQIDPNQWQTFSNGGTANGNPDNRPLLHNYYITKTPIIVPVITGARTCNGNSGINCTCPPGLSPCDMQFKIVAWLAIELTNDPSTTNNSWQGRVVGHYNGPTGSSSGDTPPPGPLATSNLKLVE
jgi:Flp pilus assembly protein TadG